MLVTEYKYRNFIIRHTKDNKGFDIIAVSKELPKNLRKSIRWGLSSLTEAELVVDKIYEKDSARQRMKDTKNG